MGGLKSKCRIVSIAIFAIWAVLLALSQLLKPAPNGCVMTYMYPTYIPIATPANVSSDKYGLFLYHEGWQEIDFADRVKKLSGVPVLFIPGNGGSYKQVRSLAAESFRAYQSGPPEPTFYQEASFSVPNRPDKFEKFIVPARYGRTLDWFAVDLEGEHSAMDGRILEEHTEYVVYSIHRILDQYRESFEKRAKEGSKGKPKDELPMSVIIVGHSMGGFVARAALVHPHLREACVHTLLTLSSPHQSPPVALQPSLGHFFSHVNQEWRNGYKSKNKKFSNLVVISISGGINDYQVRSKLTSLDGIIPATHGFTLGSTAMKNVWLSMEHQTILWCNQLVVQVSHTLLSIIDPETKRPFSSSQKRLFVFTEMLQTAIPQALSWTSSTDNSNTGSEKEDLFSCPESVKWVQDGLERDLHIKSNIITVLAMDGRRRWLDISKLGSDGKDHFVFVTNLAPCTGVRIHLWPEKVNNSAVNEVSPAGKRIVEVTSKMVHVPAGPAPKQVEPGSQTEQPPPSSFLRLSPQDLEGFRFLTISVAPRPTVSGRPPPAASMAVGQFFNPKRGEREFSLSMLLHSIYSPKEINLEEDHALEQKLSFSVSLGLLPVSLSLETTGCGIKGSTDKSQEEQNRLCKLRCFPPVAMAWDSTSGLHVIPNIFSQIISVDSSPALWDPVKSSEKTSLLLLADPHCSYRASVSVSITASTSRFFLLYSSQIVGFMLCTIFFALMQQAHAWESDSSVPSVLQALEMNLNLFHKTFFLLFFVPIIISLLYSFFIGDPLPFLSSFVPVTFICYIISNGLVILVVLVSKSVLYSSALLHVLVKRRWQAWESNIASPIVNQILRFSSSFRSTKIVQKISGNPNLIVALIAIPLVCFVHPALGLCVLLLSHALHAHSSLTSVLAASFRSQESQKKQLEISSPLFFKTKTNKTNGGLEPLLPTDETAASNNSPTSAKSFIDDQLETFNYRHSVLILHLFGTLMFVPSFATWLQRLGTVQNYPWFIDSALCIGLILHGLFGSKPNTNHISFKLPTISNSNRLELGFSFVYLIGGYYSFISAMSLAPYKSLYAVAFVGVFCFVSAVFERNRKDRKSKKHSHKH
ncbi:hypothetical protein LUZ60_008676 [Juncus effusus]|nr:hypothetical protein LUZ60_008676 [Juncus effusus]